MQTHYEIIASSESKRIGLFKVILGIRKPKTLSIGIAFANAWWSAAITAIFED